MPLTIRRSDERGHFDHGWLDTIHTFSFGEYDDPEWRGFRTLRVINEDRVAPGRGFDMHGHRDMEIITVVLEGELAHRDSLGSGSVIRSGDVQTMSAGAGIMHSEFNASKTIPVHLLQIWIRPNERSIEPRCAEATFPRAKRRNELILIASPEPRDGALAIHQDAKVYLLRLDAGEQIDHALAPGRAAWVQVASGDMTLHSQPLAPGDGAAVSDERELHIAAQTDAELLIFDLA